MRKVNYTDKEIADAFISECMRCFDAGGLDKLKQLRVMLASMKTHNSRVKFWEAQELVESWIRRMEG